ncbi:hypothetical protein PAXRUDRAFT_138931 [Paxillus rubicundulus Ve08.2h10]|uniref:Sulphur transport domain-containing protein n=1 Tax=Paxillus rubicundulus Ve08.2h10 TaxID=930991 RepID=A0A0D0EA05_9AGAM|nr:hypothetical protein PAXRUDRAFT_138931 [Paxillus rubicundulus Ve08.2h10]
MQLAVSHPKPLQALLGGVGIALSVHSLLVCNGAVLGVSGFVHRSVRGDKEAGTAVLGMVLGGVATGFLADRDGAVSMVADFPQVILGGFLVGVGTKLANGCTSGFLNVLPRSLVATMSFFSTAVLTTQILHRGNLPESAGAEWSLGNQQGVIFALGMTLASLWALVKVFGQSGRKQPPSVSITVPISISRLTILQPPLRFTTSFLTAFTFGISLRLGNMVQPEKVLGFLATPISSAFDPSLAFLAASALPITTIFYHVVRRNGQPHFGGECAIPTSTKVDAKLIGGSVLFGLGWGICGICPGPALVILGRALYAGNGIATSVSWLISMVVGGLLVG